MANMLNYEIGSHLSLGSLGMASPFIKIKGLSDKFRNQITCYGHSYNWGKKALLVKKPNSEPSMIVDDIVSEHFLP